MLRRPEDDLVELPMLSRRAFLFGVAILRRTARAARLALTRLALTALAHPAGSRRDAAVYRDLARPSPLGFRDIDDEHSIFVPRIDLVRIDRAREGEAP